MFSLSDHFSALRSVVMAASISLVAVLFSPAILAQQVSSAGAGNTAEISGVEQAFSGFVESPMSNTEPPDNILNGTEDKVSEEVSLEAAPSLENGQTTPSALLPHNLTPLGMFQQADWVVKAVMIGLLIASVVTWTLFIAKTLELRLAARQERELLKGLLTARSLQEARVSTKGLKNIQMLEAASLELQQSGDALHDADGIKERVESFLDRLLVAQGRAITKGTGVLATIGSTAPFVGLFGTVWGIMNSFIGISEAQTTNLAVVAPGIAEALLATALGLVAAIPAVIIYNLFARQVAAFKGLLGDSAAAILRLVSRDLSRASVEVRPLTQVREA